MIQWYIGHTPQMTGQGTWRGWTLKQPEAEMNQKGQEKHQKEMDA